jgi:hypothetical protein
MPLFLFVVLSIYAAMYVYLAWEVVQSFPDLGWLRAPFFAFLALMFLAPLIVVQLDRRLHFRWAKVAALFGYLWMAGLFWFCVLALAAAGWNLAVTALAVKRPGFLAATITHRTGFAAACILIAVALAAGALEAQRLRLKRVTIRLPRLPQGLRGLKLLQISDLHLGVHLGQRRLGRVLDLVREAQADMLISTGDLADSAFENIRWFAEELREINPPHGKFAVFGNHEFYAGVANSLAFHAAAGFTVLRGTAATPVEGLRIVGVDDPAGRHMKGVECFTDEAPLWSDGGARAVTVLLKHQPRLDPASAGRCALQLSGHTHGGQVFPFHVVVRSIYPLFAGLYAAGPAGQDTQIYVHRGTGTWGPPLRLFSPPEVTLIILE